MLVDYLVCGVKAGLAAGLVFGLLLAFVANPLVGFADGAAHAPDAAGHHGDEGHHGSVVSAAVTEAVSVLSGVLWAVLLGGLVFGVGFYVLEPAIPGAGATKSYVLGGAGFLTVSGAPWLVLPPTAPGVEQSLPVDTRIPLYAGMMAAGALACLLSGYVYHRASDAVGPVAAAAATTLPLALLAVPALLAPTNVASGALPAGLRASVTGVVVFGQGLLWLVLAGTHARLHDTDRTDRDVTAPDPDSGLAAD